jgi:uncharacterized membrane protein
MHVVDDLQQNISVLYVCLHVDFVCMFMLILVFVTVHNCMRVIYNIRITYCIYMQGIIVNYKGIREFFVCGMAQLGGWGCYIVV